jgi:hypothetical protein
MIRVVEVRYLWLITLLMLIAGLSLFTGSLLVGLGPVALIGGVLLVWSAIVKVIVLRIWHGTLASGPTARPGRHEPIARSGPSSRS